MSDQSKMTAAVQPWAPTARPGYGGAQGPAQGAQGMTASAQPYAQQQLAPMMSAQGPMARTPDAWQPLPQPYAQQQLAPLMGGQTMPGQGANNSPMYSPQQAYPQQQLAPLMGAGMPPRSFYGASSGPAPVPFGLPRAGEVPRTGGVEPMPTQPLADLAPPANWWSRRNYG